MEYRYPAGQRRRRLGWQRESQGRLPQEEA
jgi:hypothetical protein